MKAFDCSVCEDIAMLGFDVQPDFVHALIGIVEKYQRSGDVRTWPDDEARLHRSSALGSFSARDRMVRHYRAGKMLAELLGEADTPGT